MATLSRPGSLTAGLRIRLALKDERAKKKQWPGAILLPPPFQPRPRDLPLSRWQRGYGC